MKRGKKHRRAPRARSRVKPDHRRTLTGLPIAIVCIVLAGAGTAALWAVESGVVTSASTDPASIVPKSSSSAVRDQRPIRPIARDSGQPRTAAERLRAWATASNRAADGNHHEGPDDGRSVPRDASADHDGHDHDADDHDADDHHTDDHGPDADNPDSRDRSRQSPTLLDRLSRQPIFDRRQGSDVEDIVPRARRSSTAAATSVATTSTDLDIEFWVEWGGGQPQSWFGTLRLDRGEIKTARGYGLQADAPGSQFLENNVVTISPRLPRSYDSVLMRVVAPRDASLKATFVANGSPSGAFEAEIPLLELLKSTQQRALDDNGNRLIIRRSTSDRLRIETDRTSMIFEPNEVFRFSVLPNLIDSIELQHRCRVQLTPARTESNLWVDEREAIRNADGSISPAGPFKVTMPDEEGVYDLIISIDKRRSTPVAPAQWSHWRKLQVVVVEPEKKDRRFLRGGQEEGPRQQFQVIQEFDPAHPGQPLAVKSGLSFFKQNETARRPTSHGEVIAVNRLETDLLEIGTDSWFALPLQISQPGRPHILEIDYPNDALQTLGIMVFEPGSPRAVVDTALTTVVDNLAERPGVNTHRVTFWPRTSTPTLVLADRDAERAAAVGAIRVVAGPDRLPDLGTSMPEDGRLLAAHLETPLFPELFSATSDVDQASGRELRDWVTFFDGAKRLIEVLKRRGYNGAVIPVLTAGGALYPSAQLTPTPRFDDGVFFTTAQDPMQKDVLEMLLRMFDHEGLRLVPSVEFTGTLPILEAKRRLGGRPSINLVNTGGKRWRPRPDSFGAGNHYNPLDQEVQSAMRTVVAELAQRCGPHASFAGVAIKLDPGSYANLPGADWGADDATLKRFMSAQPGSPANPLSEQGLRQEWLAWRADRLAEMYHEMSRNLHDEADGTRLYLLGSSLLNTPQVADAAKVVRAPSGLTAAGTLIRFGINVDLLREQGIVFLAPRQVQPVLPDRIDLDRAWDLEFAKLFGQRADTRTGSLLHHPLQTFDATSISDKLGIEEVAPVTRTRISETGARGRRGMARALAALDSQAIFDGAWQTPRDERMWRDTVTVYRQLPGVQFTTVSPPVGSRTQPVVIRRHERDGKTLFYVVNDSSRPVATEIGFDGNTALALKSLSATALPKLERTEQGATLSLALRPYEVAGFEASLPGVQVVRWETQVDPQVVTTLQKKLKRLNQCVAAKRDYPSLANPDFDQPTNQDDVIPGWAFGKGAGMHVQVDTDSPQHGSQALHLRSETPVNWSSGPVVWLRSEWFAPSQSGRLVFGGWMKTRDFENQPHVRVLVEGRLPDNQLVRRERVLGAARNDPAATPLGADWNYYAVFVEGLPANVKEVRVGIDLRGTGDVWIDHVGVYDLWLNEQERAGLTRDIGIATSMLEEGRVSGCEHLLKSHYAQYLLANFPAQAIASQQAPATATVGDAASDLPSEPSRQSPSIPAVARPDAAGKQVDNSIVGELPAGDAAESNRKSDNEPRQFPHTDAALRLSN